MNDDDLEEKMRRADAAVAALAENFVAYIEEDIDSARAAMGAALERPGDCDDALHELHAAAHNIKGLGGSFGYDLVTDVANSLCLLLKLAPHNTPDLVQLADAHMQALTQILDDDVKGDGGEAGRAVLVQLTADRERVLQALG